MRSKIYQKEKIQKIKYEIQVRVDPEYECLREKKIKTNQKSSSERKFRLDFNDFVPLNINRILILRTIFINSKVC